MSTIKKLLALTLALAMVLSVSAFAGFSGSSYKDAASINGDCEDAIELLYALDIMTGDDKGNFNPEATITRAEVAKMIYVILNYGDDDKAVNYTGANIFSDVVKGAWYEGYVNYMAMTKLVQGRPDGTFGPNDPITTAEAAKMLLTAIGYSAEARGYVGAGWDKNVLSDAAIIGLLDGYKANTTSYAPRQWVAVMFKNALTGAYTYGTIAPVIFNGLLTGATLPTYKEEYKTMGYKYFGLTLVDGIIDAISYQKGTTTIDGVVVENTDADFETIGYAAYVWAVKTSGAKTYTAVSDVVVTGESLALYTDGTSYDYAIDYDVDLDDEYDLYYNGVLAASKTKTGWEVKNATANTAFNAAITGKVGVKLDFVDNDNGGKAEAVIATEYTVATVTGIAKDTNTGWDATTKDAYYFDYTTEVKAKYLVCDDELAYQDLVTYVKYNTEYYTVLADLTVADLDRINYRTVNYYNPTQTSYVFDGETYLASDLTKQGYLNALDKTNLNETFDVYTDAYGNIILAQLSESAINYLYVMANDHTVGTTGVTNTKVAYADGSIDANLPVISVDGVKTFNVNRIDNHIYSYTETTDGEYKLYLAHTNDMVANYTTNLASWGGYGVDLETVVVDLRSSYRGNVYTGYAEIPSLTDARICFIADQYDYIELAFLVGGTNTNDLSAEFVVFNTAANYIEHSNSKDWYYLDVMVDGVLVEDYKLSKVQYQAIDTYGVGVYAFDEHGELDEYTSFAEEWTWVKWQAGSVLDIVAGKYYTYANDSVKFNVLNIDKGTVNDYAMQQGFDYYAYLVYNSKKTQVVEIYIIVDVVDNNNTITHETQVKDGYTYYYTVEDKEVTKVNPVANLCNVVVDGTPYWTVTAGTVKVVPSATTGTGVKVTMGGVVSYAAYGSDLKITADTTIETGYVAFIIDGVATPVLANAEVAVNTLTDKGTYVKNVYPTGWNWKNVASDIIKAGGVDHVITTGFYKVTVAESADEVKLVAGKLLKADGTEYVAVDGVVEAGEYYALAGTVLTQNTDSTSAGDKTFTVGPNDVNIA